MFRLGDIIKKKRQGSDQKAFNAIGNVTDLLAGTALVQKMVQQDRKQLSLKYQFPATLKKAKRHVRAIKYGYHGIRGDQKRKLCPCCRCQINTEQMSIFKDHTTVLFGVQGFRLNSSVAFFFTFIKYLIVLLLIRFIIVDIFNMVTNLTQGKFCEQKCSKQFWSLSSIFHKYNRLDLIDVTNILTFAMTLIFIICFIAYKKLQYSMYDKIDELNQTQDDFTIFVQNIPILDFPQFADEKGNFEFDYDKDLSNIMQSEIQKWIQEMDKQMVHEGSIQKDYIDYLGEDTYQNVPSDIIKSVSLCYDLSRMEKISKMRDQLIAQHQANVSNQKQSQIEGVNQKFDTIPEQIQFLNECEVTLSKSLALQKSLVFKATHFVGSAFISFKYQHYRDHIIQTYMDNSKAFKMKDRYLRITKATYPTDILWKNIKISDSQRLKKVIASYGILTLVLIIAFCILVGSDTYKNFLLKNFKKSQQHQQKQKQGFLGSIDWGSMLIGLVTTLITLALNAFLSTLVTLLTNWERHQSKAHAKSSLVGKLLIMQFLNTAIIYLALSYIRDEDETGIMSKEGLIFQISNLLIMSGFIQIFNNVVNTDFILRWVLLLWKYWGKDDEDQIPKFQVNLNRQLEHFQFDLAYKYSYFILQFYMVAFYAYVIPLSSIAIAAVFFGQYWVQKYNLFKRSSLFYEVDYSISRYMLKYVQISILLSAIGALIFSVRLEEKFDIILVINLIIAGIYIILSTLMPQKFSKRFMRAHETCQRFQYDQCVRQGKFKNTYWLTNPATLLVDEATVTSRQYQKNYAAYQYTLKDKTDHSDLDQDEDEKLKQALRMYPI